MFVALVILLQIKALLSYGIDKSQRKIKEHVVSQHLLYLLIMVYNEMTTKGRVKKLSIGGRVVNFDVKTLQSVLIIIFLSALGILIILWRINKKEGGFYFFFGSIATLITSFALLSFESVLGNMVIVLNNIGLVISMLLQLAGIVRFKRITINRFFGRLFFLLALFVLVITLVFSNSPRYQYMVVDFIITGLLLLCWFIMIFKTKGLQFVVFSVTANSFLLFTPVFIYRWYLAVSGNITSVGLIVDSAYLTEIIYILSIPGAIGWIMGLNLVITYRNNQSLMDLSMKDNLTNAENRRSLFVKFDKILQANVQREYLLFVLDIDGFKQINDMHGHLVGDKILIHVADCLHSSTRECDNVVRYGGDEFIVLVDNDSNVDPSFLVKRFKACITKPVVIKNQIIITSVSIGFAKFPQDYNNLEELIQYADSNMYQHKENNMDELPTD